MAQNELVDRTVQEWSEKHREYVNELLEIQGYDVKKLRKLEKKKNGDVDKLFKELRKQTSAVDHTTILDKHKLLVAKILSKDDFDDLECWMLYLDANPDDWKSMGCIPAPDYADWREFEPSFEWPPEIGIQWPPMSIAWNYTYPVRQLLQRLMYSASAGSLKDCLTRLYRGYLCWKRLPPTLTVDDFDGSELDSVIIEDFSTIAERQADLLSGGENAQEVEVDEVAREKKRWERYLCSDDGRTVWEECGNLAKGCLENLFCMFLEWKEENSCEEEIEPSVPTCLFEHVASICGNSQYGTIQPHVLWTNCSDESGGPCTSTSAYDPAECIDRLSFSTNNPGYGQTVHGTYKHRFRIPLQVDEGKTYCFRPAISIIGIARKYSPFGQPAGSTLEISSQLHLLHAHYGTGAFGGGPYQEQDLRFFTYGDFVSPDSNQGLSNVAEAVVDISPATYGSYHDSNPVVIGLESEVPGGGLGDGKVEIVMELILTIKGSSFGDSTIELDLNSNESFGLRLLGLEWGELQGG